MRRLDKIHTMGLPLDANLLPVHGDNRNADRYYTTDAESESKETSENKKTDIETYKTSNTFFPSIKAVYDWAIGLFVKGDASSTDNAIVRYDGATGKLVQNSDVFITDDGYVGVGTPNPGAKLDVFGAVGSLFRFGDTANFALWGQDSGGAYVQKVGATTATSAFRFQTFLTGGSNYVGFRISEADGYQYYDGVDLSPGTKFVIKKTTGYVGVGTPNPTAKLDVNGTSRFHDSATFDGQIIDSTGSGGVDGYILECVAGLPVWRPK